MIKKIVFIICLIVFLNMIFEYFDKEYEYIDYNNNREISHKCYGNKERIIVCVKDGKLIKVKQYIQKK